MTIAAQHVRAALHHLRTVQPAWRPILKSVGPFTMRVERQPAWWLTHHLHCRSFWDFAHFRSERKGTIVSVDGHPNGSTHPNWGEEQRGFWSELQDAEIQGRLDLSVPISSKDLAETRDKLIEILARYRSTIIDRFEFYCWGGLDSWPKSDLQLMDVVASSFTVSAPQIDANTLTATVATWSPYRSIAAWYLEQWAERQRFGNAE